MLNLRQTTGFQAADHMVQQSNNNPQRWLLSDTRFSNATPGSQTYNRDALGFAYRLSQALDRDGNPMTLTRQELQPMFSRAASLNGFINAVDITGGAGVRPDGQIDVAELANFIAYADNSIQTSLQFTNQYADQPGMQAFRNTMIQNMTRQGLLRNGQPVNTRRDGVLSAGELTQAFATTTLAGNTRLGRGLFPAMLAQQFSMGNGRTIARSLGLNPGQSTVGGNHGPTSNLFPGAHGHNTAQNYQNFLGLTQHTGLNQHLPSPLSTSIQFSNVNRQGNNQRQYLDNAFGYATQEIRRFDTNRDGKLNLNEITGYVRQSMPNAPNATVTNIATRILQGLDVANQNTPNQIDVLEMTRLILGQDSNGDGRITMAESAAALGRLATNPQGFQQGVTQNFSDATLRSHNLSFQGRTLWGLGQHIGQRFMQRIQS